MGQHRVVEPDDAGEAGLARSQAVQQVVPDLGLDRAVHVATGAKLAQCSLARFGWTHAIDTTSPIRDIAPSRARFPCGSGVPDSAAALFGWRAREGGNWKCERPAEP
ncbi:hypothetical protein Acsp03_24120 [Actinomadura sp. NBRC 104412]|nr:hypothetical protein Acsp03_24120 [Actinomadura sp. NBRC 104412]